VRQKGRNFKLNKVLIISDGSTDKTVEIVQNLKNPKIEIVDNKDNLGQMTRLRELYKKFDSDILIQTDADVVFSEHTIESVVRVMRSDERISMCGGDIVPVESTSLIARANLLSVNIYRKIKRTLRGGNNIFSATGPMLAFRREFIKNIASIPGNVVCNDRYIYLKCIQESFVYRFVPEAVVYYNLPSSLKDHIKQARRFKLSKEQLYDIFPKNLVDRELSIPKSMYLRYGIEEFLKHPLLAVYIFLVNKYSDLTKKRSKINRGIWEIVATTK